MKKALYSIAFLFLGISLGWLGRGGCHPRSALQKYLPMNTICFASLAKRPPPGPPSSERMLEEVDISEDQRLKIRAIDAKYRADLESHRSQMDALRRQFEEGLSSQLSSGELMPRYEALFEAKRLAEITQFKMMMEVREELTPEQRLQLQQKRNERGPPGGGPGGPGEGGPGGPGGPRAF